MPRTRLLKGLEEPQADAHFLLVSHRPARLLPTIRSRCVALPVALAEAGATPARGSKEAARSG